MPAGPPPGGGKRHAVHEGTAHKHQLTFTVASDPANALARALGILNPERSEEARAASAKFGSEVAGGNADGTDNVPLPTTLVVDAARVIR